MTEVTTVNTKVSSYEKRKSCNGTAAPIIDIDDLDDWQAGTHDVIIEKESKKRKRRSGPKKLTKRRPTRKSAGDLEGLQDFDADGDITAEETEDNEKLSGRVPRFISERRHKQVPLSEYFKSVDYDGARRDLKADNAASEEEEEVDDESEDSSAPHSSPKARRKLIPKKILVEDSVTESESDVPIDVLPRKKKAKAEVDSSATESDSDVMPVDSKNDEDSVTEDEEDEAFVFQRRPPFPMPTTPYQEGAMVLDASKNIAVPAPINAFLRDYQRDGVKFLWDKFNEGKGGLLGDDMGLGKTIQIISVLSAIMKKTGYSSDKGRRRKHVAQLQNSVEWKSSRKLPDANATWPTALIIAPSSVAMNWERELELWGFFEVGMYTSKPVERADVLKDFRLGRLDVVVTTFEIARSDIELLCDGPWSCVIVDEVHRVKNRKASTTVRLNLFECPVRLGLTGTAIQNDYTELWTILDWTNPRALGTPGEWTRIVATPLKLGQSKSATPLQTVVANQVAQALTKKLLPNFFLRRTKDIIKDQMPNKFDKVMFCPLTDKQMFVYKRLLGMESVQNILLKDELCDCRSGKKRQQCHHPMSNADMLRYISVMIKISNHLALILPASTDTPEQRIRNRGTCEVLFNSENYPPWASAMTQADYCGKWLVLETLLKGWHEDKTNKVLIFTKTVKLLEILQFHVEKNNWGFERLDGSTEQSDRMPRIDRFHKDPDVWIFLISTLAGGTGLNLVGANKVVLFDPNWNPAHDLQAIDRAFRIGQTRDVEVFRFLGSGSIEELIYARQVYKQQQMKIGYEASVQTRYFDGVQKDKSKPGELFGLQNIFKLHEDLATKRAIEDANMADLDWALANMDISPKDMKKIRDAEKHTDFEGTDLGGLALFLLSDDAPDEISETLKSLGVEYSHNNADLTKHNLVEERRRLKTERRKSEKESSSKIENFVSKRSKAKNKHPIKKPMLLESRREALIGLGFIQDPEDLSAFAQQFNTKPIDEQHALIAQLDQYRKAAVPSFVKIPKFRV